MEKQRWEESEKRRREKIREEKNEKKEDAGARKGSEVAILSVFPMICGSEDSEESKSRLAQAAGAEPCDQMRDEKLHAVVALSAFASDKAKSTSRSGRFWKLRCRKSARRCGATHMSKSKCTNHTMLGPLLEVEMSTKCTPLWHEAHFQDKMYKSRYARTTFGSWDVEKVHAVAARSIEVNSIKKWWVWSTFGRSDVVLRGRRKGLCTLSKASKTWGFCSIS